MAKVVRVERPIKKNEYEIQYVSVAAQRGWMDLRATIRNALADTWDFLTRTPLQKTATNYPLQGVLAAVMRDGSQYQRWQHKPTQGGSARIWFYVVGQIVYLEQVHTHHPNDTK